MVILEKYHFIVLKILIIVEFFQAKNIATIFIMAKIVVFAIFVIFATILVFATIAVLDHFRGL